MTQVLQWLLAAVLSLWLLLTVLRNLPFSRAWLTSRDWMMLLPTWALFARPRYHDVVLLRREILDDGQVSVWHEEPIIVERRWWAALWHPELGPKRALLSLVAGVEIAGARQRRNDAPKGQGSPGAAFLMTGTPYLILLNYVSARCGPRVQAVQFLVVGMTGQILTGRYDTTRDGFVVFASEFHRTNPGSTDPTYDTHAVREPVRAG
jgi:hypothetical protein